MSFFGRNSRPPIPQTVKNADIYARFDQKVKAPVSELTDLYAREVGQQKANLPEDLRFTMTKSDLQTFADEAYNKEFIAFLTGKHHLSPFQHYMTLPDVRQYVLSRMKPVLDDTIKRHMLKEFKPSNLADCYAYFRMLKEESEGSQETPALVGKHGFLPPDFSKMGLYKTDTTPLDVENQVQNELDSLSSVSERVRKQVVAGIVANNVEKYFSQVFEEEHRHTGLEPILVSRAKANVVKRFFPQKEDQAEVLQIVEEIEPRSKLEVDPVQESLPKTKFQELSEPQAIDPTSIKIEPAPSPAFEMSPITNSSISFATNDKSTELVEKIRIYERLLEKTKTPDLQSQLLLETAKLQQELQNELDSAMQKTLSNIQTTPTSSEIDREILNISTGIPERRIERQEFSETAQILDLKFADLSQEVPFEPLSTNVINEEKEKAKQPPAEPMSPESSKPVDEEIKSPTANNAPDTFARGGPLVEMWEKMLEKALKPRSRNDEDDGVAGLHVDANSLSLLRKNEIQKNGKRAKENLASAIKLELFLRDKLQPRLASSIAWNNRLQKWEVLLGYPVLHNKDGTFSVNYKKQIK